MANEGRKTPKPYILTERTKEKQKTNLFYAARIRAGIGRAEAAERIGISVQSIADYENGQSKPALIKTWKKMTEVYGCTYADILGEEVIDSETDHTATIRKRRRKGEKKVG